MLLCKASEDGQHPSDEKRIVVWFGLNYFLKIFLAIASFVRKWLDRSANCKEKNFSYLSERMQAKGNQSSNCEKLSSSGNNEEWNIALSTVFTTTEGDDTRENREKAAVFHLRQKHDWDCGIACILMSLEWLGMSRVDAGIEDWCISTVATRSIWTIDLVFILNKLMSAKSCNFNTLKEYTDDMSHFSCFFSSRSLSANPAFCSYPYYASNFASDYLRVQSRLKDVKNHTIQQPYLDIMEVVKLVKRQDCIAIALVDNNLLGKCTCNNDMNSPIESQLTTGSYTGHYIVLGNISYDPDDIFLSQKSVHDAEASTASIDSSSNPPFCFVIHNPGSDMPFDYVSVSNFQQAWRAQGTDDDIIFIQKRLVGEVHESD